MNTCSNFVPGHWKPDQCQECFQSKENHLVTSLAVVIPKPRRRPTVIETPNPVPMLLETPMSTSAPTLMKTPIVLSINEASTQTLANDVSHFR